MGSRNYREIDLLRQMEAEMARIADETLRGFLSDAPPPNRYWQPRVDVYETPESVIVKAEISGVRSEHLSVELGADDRVLTISGERYEEDGDHADRIRCYQLEITFGPFERQILLPTDTRIDREGIQANCRDGFLVVTLPKRNKPAGEARTIQISE